MLLQIRVDASDGHANSAVGIPHSVAKNLGRDDDKRQHREGDKSQLPVHPQHHDQNSEEHEEIFEDRDHSRGEHVVQSVHIGGDAGYQAPNRVLVIKSDVNALQMAENLAAQVKHYFLAGPLHVSRSAETPAET